MSLWLELAEQPTRENNPIAKVLINIEQICYIREGTKGMSVPHAETPSVIGTTIYFSDHFHSQGSVDVIQSYKEVIELVGSMRKTEYDRQVSIIKESREDK